MKHDKYTCNNRKGFSIVELIVVLVILAILAAILVPSLIGYIDKSKEKICTVNRLDLMRQYDAYLYLEPDMALSEFMSLHNQYSCPSGGTYSVITDPDTFGQSIVCSKHNHSDVAESTPTVTATQFTTPTPTLSPTQSPNPDIIPGTGISVNSTWPSEDEFFDTNGNDVTVYLYKGDTFRYLDQYYIVGLESVNFSPVYPGRLIPTPLNGWWYSIYNEAVIKINNRIVEGSESPSEHTFSKGDILHCSVGGEYGYYVFMYNNRTYIQPPYTDMHDWVKIE